MSVLPLGTASNLARALGFFVPAKELIAHLEEGRREAFDVGRARGPWGKRYFFEGAGAGLFANYLRVPKKNGKNEESKSKAEEMRQHVTELRRRLRNHKAEKWEFELDGEDFSGRYLLWQAMNIRSVGPVLTVATDEETNDGAFDFVGAREDDRTLLLDYLDARLAGKKRKFPVPAKRFRKMRNRRCISMMSSGRPKMKSGLSHARSRLW